MQIKKLIYLVLIQTCGLEKNTKQSKTLSVHDAITE